MIMQSRGLVPDNILLAHHPLVDDAEQAEKDLEAQQAKQDECLKKKFGNDDVPYPPGGDKGDDGT